MCKWHTELKVLVCCLSEKEQSMMVWKTTDGFHVPQQSYPNFVTLALKNFWRWKIFVCLIFVIVGHRQNICNDKMSQFTVHSQTCKSCWGCATLPPSTSTLTTTYLQDTVHTCVYWARDEAKVTPGIPRVQVLLFFFSIKHLSRRTLLLHVQGFRNLEIEYCFVTGIKQPSCPRLRRKQSERI